VIKNDALYESKTVVKKRMMIDITRMTVHNGPGIRTVLFFKGCPLRCVWCSTPESQKEPEEIAFYPDRCILCGDCIPACPKNALTACDTSVTLNRDLCDVCGRCVPECHTEALKIIGRQYSVDQLIDEIKKDEVLYKHSGGGVTISGGEPFFKPEFLLELLKELKQNSINVGIDTCGYTPRKTIKAVMPYVDFYLWDVKHIDREKHMKHTGVSNELILDNLRFVSDNNIPIYLRVPLIPGYNDSEKNLLDICDCAKHLASLVEIHLLPLHHLGKARYAALERNYPIEGLPLLGDDFLTQTKHLIESTGLKCSIIG
jgi:pyruvate formate lyase activating enzyme